MRISIPAALLCVSALGLALPAAAQDMRQKIQEEIGLQHQRAHELQAIGQGDEQMANNLNQQAQALEDHANRLDQRARELRVMANAQMFNPGAKDTLNNFANELDGYARNDRANVGFRRKVAADMANSAHGAFDAARAHEDHANRMQAWLNQMNQPPPPQQTNPWQ
jgi:hypothetical protein